MEFISQVKPALFVSQQQPDCFPGDEIPIIKGGNRQELSFTPEGQYTQRSIRDLNWGREGNHRALNEKLILLDLTQKHAPLFLELAALRGQGLLFLLKVIPEHRL